MYNPVDPTRAVPSGTASATWLARALFSLRAKIFLLIALALAPLIGFHAYDLYRLRDQQYLQARRLAFQLARDGAERQGNLMSQASAILDVAVELPALRTTDVDACHAFLKVLKSNNPWADTFGLLDLSGYPVCGNNATIRNVDLSDREYFQQALKLNRAYVSGFLVARVTDRPTVVISRSVRNYVGEVSGVLVATVDLGWLQKLIGEVARDGNGRTLLMDRHGTVLAGSPDDEHLVGKSIAHVSGVAEVLRESESTGEGPGADGVVRIRAATTIASSGEKLVVAFDKAVIMAHADAELTRNKWRITLLVLLAALLALFGSEVLVLRWIRRLTAAADKLGRGEFAIQSGIPTTAGELASVGHRLDVAGTQLGQRDASLRKADTDARDANTRLRMAEEIARIGHWHVALPTHTLIWSDGVYLLHGLDRETYSPSVDTAVDFYHPDDRAEVAALVANAIENAASFDFALRIVRADGELRDVVSRGLCEVGPDGTPIAVFGTIMDVTELRRAERDAEQTSALLSATLESMDEGLLVVSPAGRIEICNARAMALLGLPLELTTQKPTTQTVLDYQWTAGEFDGVDEPLRQFLRSGGSVSGPHSYVRTRPNGVVLEIRSMPMAGGGHVRTYADITARRKAEAAVAESEARYRMLAESTSDVITRLGVDFRREYVSPACRRLLGYEPDEMLGEQPSTTIHPDDAADVRALAAKLLAGQMPDDRCTAAYRARHKDGRWIWIEAGMLLARDEVGQPTSIVCSLRDIGKRMAAEVARAEIEARYRLLADHSSDLIALRPRRGGTRSYVSPSAVAMLGYQPEELVDSAFSELVHPDDLATLEESLAGLSVEKPQTTSTHRIRRKDGDWIWIEAVFRLTDAGSTHENVIIRARDVTELKRQAVHLEAARNAAEAAARAKSEFLANMSHELRTPLTGMLGVHDILQHDDELGERQRRLVKLAQEAGRSLLTIVNDVLDYSKIDAGELAVESVPFSLRSLVESCRSLSTETIGAKPVKLSANVAPDVPDELSGDPTRIRQVVLNLTTNAIKFTLEGDVAIRVTGVCGRLRVAISDTGIGIEAAQIPLLFNRFSQADSSTTRRFGGTGLGLAISKRLVELMGGSLWVESEPGSGSTFSFDLPLDQVTSHAVERRETAALSSRAIRTKRLLVAEDNLLNQEIIRTVLERKGHEVTIAPEGATAVSLFRSETFDLVLMDMQMPGMDGLAATSAIRAFETAEGRHRIPIVALTANATNQDSERCTAAGMDGHIAKPIDWSELFATIDRLCPEDPILAAPPRLS